MLTLDFMQKGILIKQEILSIVNQNITSSSTSSYTIGRNPDQNNIHIENTSISRIHCKIIIKKIIYNTNNNTNYAWKWGLGIGDWGLGIGDWAQSPIPNPQSPIPMYMYII